VGGAPVSKVGAGRWKDDQACSIACDLIPYEGPPDLLSTPGFTRKSRIGPSGVRVASALGPQLANIRHIHRTSYMANSSESATLDFSRFDKINYGCGFDKRPGYLNVDMDPGCEPDYLIPVGDFSGLPRRHFSEVYAKDVLEHIPRVKTLDALLDFSSLLRPGGSLVVQTTNILQVAKMLRDRPSFADQHGWTQCLFGTQAHPGDFHFTGFTDTSLTVHLEAAGFRVLSRSLVDDWMMLYTCTKYWEWDDLEHQSSNDADFVRAAYNAILNREPDEGGRCYFLQTLAAGETRRSALKTIASAPERLYVTARRLGF
jgi:hypothetical protein